VAEHRLDDPMERGERQLTLGLDPSAPQDSKVARPGHGLIEQSGLADSGLATEDQGSAPRPPGLVEQPIEEHALGRPAVEHVTNSSSGPVLQDR
jgi:hypothetical protein